MEDLISEIVGFTIVTTLVVLLAYFTKKLQNKYEEE